MFATINTKKFKIKNFVKNKILYKNFKFREPLSLHSFKGLFQLQQTMTLSETIKENCY